MDTIVNASEMGNGVAYSGKVWRLYRNGIWEQVDDERIKQIIQRIIRALQAGLSKYNVNEFYELIKNEYYVHPSVWNFNPNILVFRNCVLDISSTPFLRLEHRKDYMATVSIPYDYDPAATAPIFERVLSRAMPNQAVRDFFVEFMGYSLTNSTEHQITLWLHGVRGSGKSTIHKGLEAMLGGEKYGTLEMPMLSDKFGLDGIQGKTLLLSAETPGQHMKGVEKLNALVTGDTIRIEGKYKQGGEYTNTAKILWSMNNLPNVFDPTNGIFRRAQVIEITEAIPERERDPKVIYQVQWEGPGILNMALEGLERLNQRERFDIPKPVREATQRWKDSNNLTEQFLYECTEEAPRTFPAPDIGSYVIYANELRLAFSGWAAEKGNKGNMNKSFHALAEDWEQYGLTKENRTKKGIPYSGRRLNERGREVLELGRKLMNKV
jgi:putative DNA primase/helicase